MATELLLESGIGAIPLFTGSRAECERVRDELVAHAKEHGTFRTTCSYMAGFGMGMPVPIHPGATFLILDESEPLPQHLIDRQVEMANKFHEVLHAQEARKTAGPQGGAEESSSPGQ